MDDNLETKFYAPKKFPAMNLLGHSFYDTVKNFHLFRNYPKKLKHIVVNDVSKFIFSDCYSVVLVDKDTPDLIYAFVFYFKNTNGGDVVFAFTKKNVRKMGFFNFLLDKICKKHGPELYFSELLGKNPFRLIGH